MATATKKTVAKKTAAAKKVAGTRKAPAPEPRTPDNTPKGAFAPEFIAKVVDLRDNEELKWTDIGETLSCTPGKAMLAYAIHGVAPKDRIKGKTDEEIAEKIVAAREDGVSWGVISARAGIPESRVRRMYEEATGTSTKGLRVGRGGRFVTGQAPAKVDKPKIQKAPRDLTKPPAKKAAATKKAAPKKNPLMSMDLEALQGRLTGKTLTVSRNGRQERIKIKSIVDLEDGEMTLTDDGGKTRTIALADCVKASR